MAWPMTSSEEWSTSNRQRTRAFALQQALYYKSKFIADHLSSRKADQLAGMFEDAQLQQFSH